MVERHLGSSRVVAADATCAAVSPGASVCFADVKPPSHDAPARVRSACDRGYVGVTGPKRPGRTLAPNRATEGRNDPTPPTPRSGVRDVVIVGGGPAAHRLADSLHARDGGRTLRVTVVGEELHAPYDRVALSTRLADVATDLTLQPTSMWDDGQHAAVTGERVVAIDRGARTATTSGGLVLPWDDLVLATGSSAPVPDLPGRRARPGVPHDRRRRRARRRGPRPRRGATAGRRASSSPAAGCSGSRPPAASRSSARDAAVVHSGGWLMSAQLDEGAGRALGRIIAGAGHRAAPRHPAVGRRSSRTAPWSASTLTNGRHIDADLVVFAIGISPRDELARDARARARPARRRRDRHRLRDVRPERLGDRRGRELRGPLHRARRPRERHGRGRRRPPARRRGRVHERRRRDEAQALGRRRRELRRRARPHRAGARDRLRRPGARPVPEARHDRRRARRCSAASSSATPRPTPSLRPLLGTRAVERARPPTSRPRAWRRRPATSCPTHALVCACNNVTAGTDPRRRHGGEPDGDGCTELGALKACTRAGTQCGSCVPLVKKLLESELTKSGIAVVAGALRALRRSAARSCSSRCGCSSSPRSTRSSRASAPAAAATSASPSSARSSPRQHGSYILDGGRGGLQDTNDRAMANMQKDGTYSVVPRIPARRDHPAEARRDRPGRHRLRPVHEDHGRPAHRPVRRATRPAARDLEAPRRRRVRVRAGLRQGAAQREELRRLDLVPLRRAGLRGDGRAARAALPRAARRRTSSSSASRAAPASAPRRAARTSA